MSCWTYFNMTLYFYMIKLRQAQLDNGDFNHTE